VLVSDEIANFVLAFDQLQEHRRLGRAGRDDVDADAAMADLCRGCTGDADDTVLRTNIFDHVGKAGDARNRRGVDDRAAAVVEHVADLVLHAQEHAGHVNRNAALPLIDRVISKRRLTGLEAGIVERRVQAAEGVDRGLDHRLDLGFAADVGPLEHGLAARRLDFLDQIGARGLVEVGDHHARATLGAEQRGRLAHAAGAAGDKHDLSSHVDFLKTLHHPSSLLLLVHAQSTVRTIFP
jgi:hypothetical protein